MREPITLCTGIRLAIGYLALGVTVLAGGAFTVWMVIAAIEMIQKGEWWYIFGLAAIYPFGLSLVIMVPGAIVTMTLDYEPDDVRLGPWESD